MKAINLPHYKRKLNNISKDLFLEYDWTLPQGFIDKAMRNPLNLSREEWQQAKRSEQDPRLLKKLFQRAWQISDSKHAFEKALKEHGLWLAQGDRRGFVAIDYKGEIYSLSRWASVKTRALKQKLGDPEELLTVQEIQDHIADKMTRALIEHIKSIEDKFKKDFAPFKFAIQKLKRDHNHERKELREHHKDRWIAEEKTRIDAHTSYAAAAIFGVDLSILDNRPIEKYEIIFLDSHGLKNIETVFIMKEMAHE